MVKSQTVMAAQDESPSAAAANSNNETAENRPAKKRRELATGQKAIEVALDKKVDAQLIQLPLRQFAEWIEEECGIQVEIDNRCVGDAGLDPNAMEISLDMRGITLRSLLHHALRPFDLTYVISHGVLLITTRDAAAAQLVVEIYPAADLIRFRDSSGAISENAEHVIELVTTACSATSWDAVGGSGTISQFDGLLVVGQSQDVQPQVAALLDAVRASIAAEANGDTSPRKVQRAASADAEMAKALESSREYSLIETPLLQLAEMIERQTQVQLMIDNRAFEDAGIDATGVELTAEFASAPLASILDHALSQHGLAYIVDHEAIVITTGDRAASMMETYIYSVADLIARDQPATTNADSRASDLKELLAGNVDAAVWDSVGGPAQMQFAAPWKLLVVSAPRSTQRKLADTLEKLRDAKRRQAEANLAPSEAQASDDPIELRVFAIAAATDGSAETAKRTADVVRDLVPELGKQAGNGEGPSYLRALPDRLVVRHRRSVLAKVEKLLEQLETPGGGAATGAATFGR
ncbi:MAG: hypothetical protein DCC68_01990 [Planctomycetota bacterium]|nr:MAG: hypothetical protein DCC68_01990 [Planctomycetota bacterium]